VRVCDYPRIFIDSYKLELVGRINWKINMMNGRKRSERS